ncbi:MAG: Uma2 family endonuclease [Chthonomonadaceae bacterium]|nr:Uma2 family endonuclease [Chthonomonadaceae bacterium]
MSNVEVERWVSPEEYLEFERAAFEKHEYINGKIYAMAGAGIPHARVTMTLSRLIATHVQGGLCESFRSDLRVFNPKSGSYFYPDLTVICGKPIVTDSYLDTATNPLIVLEVLSPSTEAFDRGDKFAHYRLLETLRTYVLVSQKEAKIEVHSRKEGEWISTVCTGLESTMTLDESEFSVSLSEIYYGVEFPLPLPPIKHR